MPYDFQTVDVFTDQLFGGNPLAVFTDARGLDDATMQALARELNLSETTFVLPPEQTGSDARVRIFCPTYEMPFAGHPMVGTAFVLAAARGDRPARLVFEVLAGRVEIALSYDASGRFAQAQITAPRTLEIEGAITGLEVAGLVGLDMADVETKAHAPTLAGMGATFLIAQVGEAALVRAEPDLAAFRRLSQTRPALKDRLSLMLYARNGDDLHVRMFAPLAGIVEDPATGSAAVALAGLLLGPDGLDEARYRISQGLEMGRPSQLDCRAWRTPEGVRASVAGNCIPVFSGSFSREQLNA